MNRPSALDSSDGDVRTHSVMVATPTEGHEPHS